MHSFSHRTGWTRHAPRPGAAAPRSHPIDLTVSDPTACGFTYKDAFYAALVSDDAARYRPDSLGIPQARQAISDYYRQRGCEVSPEHVWLAAGTSELILQLLWLLADVGDTVAVPAPGYPLYDVLVDLAGVRCASYPLVYDSGWRLDPHSFADCARSDDLRAAFVVSPNNPAGTPLTRDERIEMEEVCGSRGVPLIVDEVFADYSLGTNELPFFAAIQPPGLSFVLSGISKVAALPQMKLAWGVVLGPEEHVREALARLDIIADAFLSVATPIQLALPRLLDQIPPMQQAIRRRCRENYAHLRQAAARSAFSLLAAEGGWSAVLRLPQMEGWDDVKWAAALLEQETVHTQPGHLFSLPDPPPHLVISLLLPPDLFLEGVSRLCAGVDRIAGSR